MERKDNIEAIMHPIVIQELLFHIAGEQNSLHHRCYSAIRAMYFHCGDDRSYKVYPDFDLQMSQIFYQVVDPNRERIVRQLGEIVASFAKYPKEQILQRYQFALKQNREFVQETEELFKDQLRELIQKIDPTADDWSILQKDPKKRAKAVAYFGSEEIERELALGYVTTIHDHLLGKNLIARDTPTELHRKAEYFVQIFSAPIKLYKELLKKFLQPDFNFEARNRENFVWDIHLLFAVGDHTLQAGTAKLYMVTSDGEIRNAAKLAGFDNKVYSYDEYVEIVRGRQANYEKEKV
jgi:hypothetical protein